MAGWEERFDEYVERLGDVLGHADRRAPLRGYTPALLLPGERMSVEPMAARVDPARVGAAHQSLHHFVAKAAWDDAALLAAVRAYALPALQERGPIRAWIVDDTGLPKKGRLSVGVARQYCGQVGKRDSCQVAVTLSVANEAAGLPVAYRLYLPEAWAADPARRATAGVPEEVGYATTPEIALDQIRQALADGVPPGAVVTDAGHGNDTDFRDGVTALGLAHVAGIQGTTSLWPPGTGPLPAAPRGGRGRPPKRLRRDPGRQPLAAGKLAAGLPTATRRGPSRVPRSGSSPSGRKARRSRRSTGSRPCPGRSRSRSWSRPPSCAGGSSGITRSSSRSWGSATSRGGAGAASTTTPPCASPRTPSWWPSAAAFPLRAGDPGSGRPSGRPATAPGAPPVRPERHSPASIATLRRHLGVALMRRLPRCPCCLRAFQPQPTALML